MRQISGIIINDDIFINSINVVKIKKFNTYISKDIYDDSDSDYDISNNNAVTQQSMMVKNSPNQPVNNYEYIIHIYMLGENDPIKLVFDNERKRDLAFNNIITQIYGHSYATLNFETK